MIAKRIHYKMHKPATPPKEGNVLMQTLFQQPHVSTPLRVVIVNLVAQAVGFVQDGTVGRTYKSAPTVFLNLMAQAVAFER